MRRFLFLSVIVVALDQLTKWVALKQLSYHAEVPVLPFLNFTLVYNRGAAFGFLNDAAGWQNAFFIAVASIFSVLIGYMLYKTDRRDYLSAIGLTLILGGAIGNLVDRLVYGHVVDFIDVYYGTWHFPAFNVADAAISLGAVALVLDGLGLVRRARLES